MDNSSTLVSNAKLVNQQRFEESKKAHEHEQRLIADEEKNAAAHYDHHAADAAATVATATRIAVRPATTPINFQTMVASTDGFLFKGYGRVEDESNLKESNLSKVPRTSVTYRTLKNTNERVTAAHLIWVLNLACFVVHTGFFVYTLVVSSNKNTWVRIYKYSQVPTQYQYDNNLTSMNMKESRFDWREFHRDVFLHDNGLPIHFGWLTASFFLVSAVFHLWALVVGAFERTGSWYWRWMDGAYCYWRWAEYSLSASLMALAIAIVIGMREQSTLASIFMLHWITMACGFLTEYSSRPKLAQIKESKDYAKEYPAYSEDKWASGEENDDEKWPFRNYIRRMVPHIIGIFPFVAAWAIIIAHFESTRADLKALKIDSGEELKPPRWVVGLIYGTICIFSSFSATQVIFQRLNPNHYWGSELIYCCLSLFAKVYLGLFILINVLMAENSVEATLSMAPQQ